MEANKTLAVEQLQRAMVLTGQLMEAALIASDATGAPVDLYDVMDYCRNLGHDENITDRSIDELIAFAARRRWAVAATHSVNMIVRDILSISSNR